jgi:hypothetical protein
MARTGSDKTPVCVKTVPGWSKELGSKTLSPFAVVASMVASNLDEIEYCTVSTICSTVSARSWDVKPVRVTEIWKRFSSVHSTL